jgi:hypothetical protein
MQRRGRLALLLGLVTACMVGWGNGERSSGPLAMTGGSHGGNVRFMGRGSAVIFVTLLNTTSATVTVLSARTPDPPNGLLRRVSTRLELLSPCVVPPGAEGPICPDPPNEAAWRVNAVTLAPGRWVAVRLDYRFVDCRTAVRASTTTAQRLVVSYRDGLQVLRQTAVPLFGAQFHLHKPTPSECPLAG